MNNELLAKIAALQTTPFSHLKKLWREVYETDLPGLNRKWIVSRLLILRDGDPGQPEITLSPLSYYWQHQAALEVLVTHADAGQRDAMLDDLFQAIAEVLADDRTLGGLCDRVMPDAPIVTTLGIDGAPSVKAATVNIELIYTTADLPPVYVPVGSRVFG